MVNLLRFEEVLVYESMSVERYGLGPAKALVHSGFHNG